jgi:hypothetical protein
MDGLMDGGREGRMISPRALMRSILQLSHACVPPLSPPCPCGPRYDPFLPPPPSSLSSSLSPGLYLALRMEGIPPPPERLHVGGEMSWKGVLGLEGERTLYGEGGREGGREGG